MASRTFLHSGDLGDIIFGLPAIRALGGGVLYLDHDGGVNDPAITSTGLKKTHLTAERIESLRPLLLQQSYISDVVHWKGEKVDHNLNLFRHHLKYQNLSDSHLAACGLAFAERDTAWITIADPIPAPADRPLIVNRSVRCQGNHGFWLHHFPAIKEQARFVGFAKEHEIFEYTFEDTIPYLPTPDILTLARVIAGCEKFIGNQSFCHALAEGMKKPLIHEVYRACPEVIFKRPLAEYV